MLALSVVLGFVHIIVSATATTSQYGSKWNLSARDDEMPSLHVSVPGHAVMSVMVPAPARARSMAASEDCGTLTRVAQGRSSLHRHARA